VLSVELTRKDALATLLTVAAVLVFAANRAGWNVWLVGTSNRWAAGAVFLLGMATCTLGRAATDELKDAETKLLAAIGVLALAFAVWAVSTASATALTLLVASNVALWAGATLRHARHTAHPHTRRLAT
jgi:F0F1-type ATP synthase assembly protein I